MEVNTLRNVVREWLLMGIAAFVLLSLLLPSSLHAVEWNQWRGPTRDGQVVGEVWPDNLSEQRLKVTWEIPLGPSYSGPIVTKDRVFTTETRDKATERVTALDRLTGRGVWQQEWKGAMTVPFFAKANGDWIRATPAWDGERLYVAGMRDVLVCLDAEDGRVLWRRDFPKEEGTPLPSFGFVSSPLVDAERNAVFVQAGACVQRLDRLTGKTVWQALKDTGGSADSAFSSPILTEVEGVAQLVVQTRTKLAGLDPEKGNVLWSVKIPAFREMNILTPTVAGDRVFTSAYGGKSLAFDLKKKGESWEVLPAWEYKAQGYMTSPLLLGGHVYWHLRNQRVACVDWQTGREQWTSGELFGKYWSMVAQGDRMLALDDRGILLLLKANPEKMEILDQRKIGEDTWAHLAVVDGAIYVRHLDRLTAYNWRDPQSDDARR